MGSPTHTHGLILQLQSTRFYRHTQGPALQPIRSYRQMPGPVLQLQAIRSLCFHQHYLFVVFLLHNQIVDILLVFLVVSVHGNAYCQMFLCSPWTMPTPSSQIFLKPSFFLKAQIVQRVLPDLAVYYQYVYLFVGPNFVYKVQKCASRVFWLHNNQYESHETSHEIYEFMDAN